MYHLIITHRSEQFGDVEFLYLLFHIFSGRFHNRSGRWIERWRYLRGGPRIAPRRPEPSLLRRQLSTTIDLTLCPRMNGRNRSSTNIATIVWFFPSRQSQNIHVFRARQWYIDRRFFELLVQLDVDETPRSVAYLGLEHRTQLIGDGHL